MAQSSNRVSSIAARMAHISPETVRDAAGDIAGLNALVKDIRSLAASVLRQDEVRGERQPN